MGFYKTNKCFFSGKEVISCDQTNGNVLDGYYYRIEYENKIREFKLSGSDDWQNDSWLKENGLAFLDLVGKYNEWRFFEEGRKLNEIEPFYLVLKNRKHTHNDGL